MSVSGNLTGMQADGRIMAWLVVGLLGSWLGLSVAYQLFMRQLIPYVYRFDVFSVLPAFRFFEAAPPYFILSYRDRFDSGAEGPWQDIDCRRQARWYIPFWHPQFISSNSTGRLMIDFAELMDREERPPMAHIQAHFPYQMLRCYVAEYPWAPSVQARQFRIVRGTEYFEDRENTLVFLSAYHTLVET
jgi:hypothetical protein